MLNKLKERAGYISIETVIVAGLMIGLGAFALSEFYATGQATTERALDRIMSVMSIDTGGTIIP